MSDLKKARVLIVDDDQQYIAALTDGLEALGYEVTGSMVAREALDLAGQHGFDVAVVDMIMPGGGAISFLHEVHSRGLTLPVVIATGRPEIADSPVFKNGLREAAAKIEKTSTLTEVNHVLQSVLPA